MGRQVIDQMVDKLYAIGVLNTEEKDLIQGTLLSQEKARVILGYIENKGTAACELFLDYLKCYDQYLFQDLKCTIYDSEITAQRPVSLSGKGHPASILTFFQGSQENLLYWPLFLFHIFADVSMQKGLYESICEQLLREPYSVDSATFMKIIETLERKVLFCLDGFDEFKPQDYPETARLFTKNVQYKHSVVLTTRTETLSQVRSYADLLVKIGDLSYSSAQMLMENVLEESLAKSLLIQLEQSSTMKEMMKTPLFVVIACAIQMGDDDFIPKTQTALFHTLHKLMINKNQYKTRDLPEEYIIESIKHCGDLALDGVFKSKFDFTIEDLSSQKEERLLLAAGLLNKYGAQRLKPVYRFFHKSFQEYTAGRRLHELLTSSSATEVSRGQMYLQKIGTISDITFKYQNLLQYTCGSSKDAAAEVFKYIVSVKDHGTLLQFLNDNEDEVTILNVPISIEHSKYQAFYPVLISMCKHLTV
eukprot:g44903.t1